MEAPYSNQRMPAEYYRREAARVRRLADDATTPAIKAHLHDIVEQYERLAQRSEIVPLREGDAEQNSV